MNKDTLSILADMADVSRSTLAEARKIIEIGDEETKRRVRAGEISINYAYYSLMKLAGSSKDAEELQGSIENIGSEVSEVKASESEAIPIDDPKSILISDINVSIKRLIELVEAGDATTNTILKELKSLLDMTVIGTLRETGTRATTETRTVQ